jgi:hypothetical protein
MPALAVGFSKVRATIMVFRLGDLAEVGRELNGYAYRIVALVADPNQTGAIMTA